MCNTESRLIIAFLYFFYKTELFITAINLSDEMKNGACCVLFCFFLSRVFLALEMSPESPEEGLKSCKVFSFFFLFRKATEKADDIKC